MVTVELTKENFKAEVLEAKGKVIVLFYRQTCADCKTMKGILENITREDVKICVLDGDAHAKIRESYYLRHSPSILFFEGGKLYNKQEGACIEQRLLEMIDEKIVKVLLDISKPIQEMSKEEMILQLYELRQHADPWWNRVKQLEKAIKEKEI